MVGDSTTLDVKKRLVVSTSTRGGRCTDENMSSVKNCRFSCDYTRENCGVICIVMQYTYGPVLYISDAVRRPVFDHLFALHRMRSEEHTSELQSLRHLVCRL